MNENSVSAAIAELAKQQAQLTQSVNILTARDPRKEFTQQQGNVGLDTALISFPKVSSTTLTPTTSAALNDSNNNMASTNCAVQVVEINFWGERNVCARSYIVLVAVFSKTPNFKDGFQQRCYLFPSTINAQIASVNQSTGLTTGNTSQVYYRRFFVQYPFVRFYLASPDSLLTNSSTVMSTLFTGNVGNIAVTFYGS